MAGQTISISILADSKGLKKGLDKVGGMLGGLGKTAATGAKLAVGALAGIGTAVAGIAIGGGIKRAIGLDEANVKFAALGFTAKDTSRIMSGALASVKGTSFGLNEAGTAAATLLGSGLKPGKELNKVLKTTANVSALTGSNMADVGLIFAQVIGSGTAKTQDLNQIASRGIPIFAQLAARYGKTQAEVRDMISAGLVPAADVLDTLNKSTDGAAAIMGGSFTGSLKNAFAALSRLTAAFITPALPVLTAALATATGAADKLGEAMAPLVQKWTDFLSTVDVEAWAAGLGDAVGGIGGSLQPIAMLAGALSPLVIIFKALEPSLPALGQAFGTLAEAVAGLAVALLPVATQIGDAITQALAALAPLLVTVVTWIANAAAGVLSFVTANKSWLSGLAVAAGVVAGVVLAVKAFRAIQLGLVAVTYGVQGAMLVAGGAASVYRFAMGGISKVTKIASGVQLAFNAVLRANPIGIIITAITALVAGLVYFFTQTKVGKKIWADFTRFLGEAWENTTKWISDALTNMGTFFSDAWTNITGAVKLAWAVIKSLLRGAITGITNLFLNWTVFGLIIKNWDKIVSFFRGLPGKIKAIFSGAINWLTGAGRNIVNGIGRGARGIWGSISSWFRGIPGKVRGFFSGAINWLWNAGSNILSGFLSGLKNAWKGVTDFVGGIGQWIADHKGPKAYDLALLVPNGGWIMSGLAEGLKRGLPTVRGALGQTMDALTSSASLDASIALNAPRVSSDARTAALAQAEAARARTNPPLVELGPVSLARLAAALKTELTLSGAPLAGATNAGNTFLNSLGGF